jgi:hypothetical protein
MISEVVIITNTNKKYDLCELINYYNIIGFDKIVLCDSISKLDLNVFSKLYKNVEYFKNTHYNQVELFNYFYNHSTADWIYFADDDEYLWFDQAKYKNVNDFIENKSKELNTNNFGIYWVKINNFNAIYKRDFNNPEESQVKLFKYINPFYEPESWIKGIYKTNQNLDFFYIHRCNPLNNYKTIDNKIYSNIRFNNYKYINNDAIIFHYFFKTYEEFKNKYKNITYDQYITLIYNQQYIKETNKIYNILYDN